MIDERAELLTACDHALQLIRPWAPVIKQHCSLPESPRIIDAVVEELTRVLARARGETPPA